MRTRLRHTTVFRLAFTYAVLFGVAVTAIFVAVFYATQAQLRAQIDAGLRGEADALALVYQAHGLEALKDAVSERVRAARKLTGSRGPEDAGQRFYLLVGPQGETLRGNLAVRLAGGAAATGFADIRLPDDVHVVDPAGDPVDSVRLHGLALGQGYRLLVAQALNESQELERTLFALLAAALAATLLIASAGGFLMGRGVLRRIAAISATAGEIMGGDLSRRIPPGRRNDEFAELARRLNAMLERIDALMASMREVTDNIAHDLRTPLTRLRGRLEVTLLDARDSAAYREAMAEAIADADGLLRTFSALLTMAQLHAGTRRLPEERIVLPELCADMVDLYGALAEEKSIDLQTAGSSGVTVRGDPELLAQALGNVLDNALKYTPAGGRIRISTGLADGTALVCVTDTGPGIPEQARKRVFERFVRLDAARSETGNGLGLAMVKSVVDAHGGEVVLMDAHPGLEVRISLPSAPEGQP